MLSNADNKSSSLSASDMEVFLQQKETDWLSFIEHNVINPDVDPMIAQSWIRSKSAGIDCYHFNVRALDPAGLQKKLEENSVLLSLAEPLIQRLSRLEASHISLISLHDKEGLMLAMYHENTEDYTWHDKCFEPGVYWSESDVGTNALGLALIENKPVRLIGMEHFVWSHRNLCCCAAPFYDAYGQLAGVLNVCSDIQNYSDQLMPMIEMCSYTISDQLKAYNDNKINTYVMNAISENVLLLDYRFTIIRCSHYAASQFGTDTESILGCHILDLLLIPDFERKMEENSPDHLVFYGCRSHYNGRYLQCDVTITAICEESQPPVYLVTFRNTQKILREMAWLSGSASYFTFEDIHTNDPALKNMSGLMKECAVWDSPVLLIGEAGTQKFVFVHAIHSASNRRSAPLITVDCENTPAEFLPYDLFGCEKKLFSSAQSPERQAGKIEMCEGGTLYLSNIDSMPIDIQERLLEVLRTHTMRKWDSQISQRADVRIIASSARDLSGAVESGQFLPALYEILSENVFRISPLRERKNDIPLLAEKYVENLNRIYQGDKACTPEFLQRLKDQEWPFNERQLYNAISIAYRNSKQLILAENYPEQNSLSPVSTLQKAAAPADGGAVNGNEAVDGHTPDLLSEKEQQEKEQLMKLLAESGYDTALAAKKSGISRATLYRYMKKYQINRKKLLRSS